MAKQPQIVLSVQDYTDTEVVLHDTTIDHITFMHADFSVDDIKACLEDPVLVHTNPEGHEHPERQNYYGLASRGPTYRRVVVDHSTSPSMVRTAFRTDHIGDYGSIVYMKPSQGKR